jgi:alkylation response protein AidB-like acyl-CoA dehydrogenase
MDAAWKIDQGREVRTEASMIKVFGTEMATEIIDQAMQTYGAMGMTKEMPLQLMASQVRTMRIYEGHRKYIAGLSRASCWGCGGNSDRRLLHRT